MKKRYSLEYGCKMYSLIERTQNKIIYENPSMKKVLEYIKKNNIELIKEEVWR